MKMSLHVAMFFVVLTGGFSYAQNLSYTIQKIYCQPTDSSVNYCTVLYPDTSPSLAYMVLLPGLGETPEDVMQQTQLPVLLAQQGIFTMIPVLQHGVYSFGVDSVSQQTLSCMIDSVTAAYHLSHLSFFIGGFSIGGSTAIKYTEKAAVKPLAVFAIDPPLDFERVYRTSQKSMKINAQTDLKRENQFLLQTLCQLTGGSPDSHIQAYYGLSPYAANDTAQTALRSFLFCPVRIYCEPDILWWSAQYGVDISGMNVTDASGFINELNLLGHTDASLILTQQKGYLEPGHIRNPHSWSIVNNLQLIQWLFSYL